MAAQRPRTLFKITVLGDGGVGKTALTVQFTMASFVETYDPTIEDCYRKQWSVDGQPCMLEVLDTAGQEEYTALRDQWIRDGEGFLVVYSVASRQTFDRVESIVRRIHRVKDDSASYGSPTTPSTSYSSNSPGGARLPIVLLGNKRDLPNGREVTSEEGARLAQRIGADFFETSAKSGVNVEKAFQTVVRGIRIAKGGGVGNGSAKGHGGGTGSGGGSSIGQGGGAGYGNGAAAGGPQGRRSSARRGGGGKKCVIL